MPAPSSQPPGLQNSEEELAVVSETPGLRFRHSLLHDYDEPLQGRAKSALAAALWKWPCRLGLLLPESGKKERPALPGQRFSVWPLDQQQHRRLYQKWKSSLTIEFGIQQVLGGCPGRCCCCSSGHTLRTAVLREPPGKRHHLARKRASKAALTH